MKTYINEVKPYTHKDLSIFYGVSEKTFSNWLKPFQDEIGEKRGHFYTVLQVEIILAKIGIPHSLMED